MLFLALDPGLPVEGLFTPVAIGDLAAASARPADVLEETLAAAAEQGDIGAVIRALLPVEVLVPLDPTGSKTPDLTDPEFAWCRLTDDGQPIMVYTSVTRLRDELAGTEAVTVPFAAGLSEWPDPAVGMAVNPGTTFETAIPAEALTTVAQRVRQIADSVPVEVVIPAGSLDRYLIGGHDRVAGLVHRAPSTTMPLAELYTQLGLLGDGSPFDAHDETGYVIRWYTTDRDAYRTPAMDGVDLAPGAACGGSAGTAPPTASPGTPRTRPAPPGGNGSRTASRGSQAAMPCRGGHLPTGVPTMSVPTHAPTRAARRCRRTRRTGATAQRAAGDAAGHYAHSGRHPQRPRRAEEKESAGWRRHPHRHRCAP